MSISSISPTFSPQPALPAQSQSPVAANAVSDKPTQVSQAANADQQPAAAQDSAASSATYTSSGKNTSSSSKSPNALFVNYLA